VRRVGVRGWIMLRFGLTTLERRWAGGGGGWRVVGGSRLVCDVGVESNTAC
jgi:hypothetical protein